MGISDRLQYGRQQPGVQAYVSAVYATHQGDYIVLRFSVFE